MTDSSSPFVVNSSGILTVATDGSQPLVAFNTSTPLPLKLNSSNYTAWAFQFRTLLTGYDLFGFLDGSKPCPSAAPAANPAHLHWVRQDQLLLSAIVGSLEPALIPSIASSKTFKEAWDILARMYGQPSPGLSLALEPTGTALYRSNRFDYHGTWSSSEATPPPPTAVYLFYDHIGSSKSSHSLYKIDIQFTPAITTAPSLVCDFPIEKYAARGMRCARLGSKIYFLGGTEERGSYVPSLDPREVYVLELLTREFKPMTAHLNAGKPSHSIVFAANGKLYALASIPQCPNMSSTDSLSLSLFEYFDPSIGRWQVLDNLPTRPADKGVLWMGCTVLEKRQEVVLLGSEDPGSSSAKYVYNLRENKWTRHKHGNYRHPFEEGGDDYLYGLPDRGLPFKSIDGFAKMSISCTPSRPSFFHQPYFDCPCPTRFLRYLGSDLFCYIASGMLPRPHGRDEYGYLGPDPYSRGILITLFKELKENQGGEEKLSFQAEILQSEEYVIKSPKVKELFFNQAKLVGCFVVSHEQLQKQLDKKNKKKKKKKRNNNGDTSGFL